MYKSGLLPAPVIAPLRYQGSQGTKFKIGPNTYIQIKTGKLNSVFNLNIRKIDNLKYFYYILKMYREQVYILQQMAQNRVLFKLVVLEKLLHINILVPLDYN
jgi:hypothetical protein